MTKSYTSVYFYKIVSAGILIKNFFFKIIVTFPGCPSEHRKFPIKENSGLSMVSRIHPPSYKIFQSNCLFVLETENTCIIVIIFKISEIIKYSTVNNKKKIPVG